MKKLLIGLVLSVAVSAPAFAEDISNCEKIERVSVLTMESRQLGVPLSKVLKTTENKFIETMMMDAYSQPAMRTPENALRQRNEFGIKWMLVCLKST